MSFSFLIEMGWKSALISAVALLLVSILKSRSAADRAAILRLGVGLLLLLPLISLIAPSLQIEAPAAVEAAPAALAPALAAETSALPVAVPATLAPASGMWDNPEALLASIYLTGALLLGLHLLVGIFILRRWTASARDFSAEPWRSALVRASVGVRMPRLLVSDRAPSPLSWGWRRPVILLDEETVARPQDADAIMAHEMAHVVRSDWAALLLSRLAVALFWFNPLVWLLAREVGQQAEEAADSDAIVHVEPARYAQTLVTCAQHCCGARVPANSIAPSARALRRRVERILKAGRGVPSGSRWTMAAMAGCIAFAAPVAALELVPAVVASLPAAAPAPLMAAVPAAPPAPVAPAAPAVSPAPAPLPALPALGSVAALQEIRDGLQRDHSGLSEEEAEAIAAEAEASAEAALADAAVDIEFAAAAAAKAAEKATKAAAIAIAAGADSMAKGADAMDRGARQMAKEAVKLRDRNYRERKIAEAARDGERLTHQELIDAIPELEEGSREMVKGAREMREAAAEMRRQR